MDCVVYGIMICGALVGLSASWPCAVISGLCHEAIASNESILKVFSYFLSRTYKCVTNFPLTE